MKKITEFYLNRITLLVLVCLSIVGWLAFGINALLNGNVRNFVYAFILLELIVILLISFKNGETNMQKTLLGALMMFIIAIDLNDFFNELENTVNPKPIQVMDVLIILILMIAFICHLYQQSDHSGENLSVIANQGCGLVIVVKVINDICSGLLTSSDLSSVFYSVGFIFTLFLIICIETRIAEYKRIRLENKVKNTWNEENRAKAKELFKL